MFTTILKYWRIFWMLRRMMLMSVLAYRSSFWIWSAVSAGWTLFNYFMLYLLINVSSAIAGWSANELYLYASVFTMLDALTWSLFYPNMQLYTASVFDGSLSTILLKPINAQYLLMVQKNTYTNVSRFIIGFVLFARSWQILELHPPAHMLLLALVLFFISSSFLYFLWFFIATFSFWVEKLDNVNDIVPGLREIIKFPDSIYTGSLSFFLTILLPLGLTVTLPTNALLGTIDAKQAIFFVCFTAALMWVSNVFFRFSIKKYSAVGA